MRVIGMISGTSFDAIEAVAAELELDGHDARRRPAGPRVGRVTRPSCTRRSRRSLPPAATTIEAGLPARHGDRAAVRRGRRRARRDARSASEVDVVCSHGQTVFHWVEGAHALGTLQLGQPAFIAERTGATVVSDVRTRDIAAGGHGAPLASLLDVLLLGSASRPRARLAQPRRHLERHGRRARPRADRLRHRPGERADRRRRRRARPAAARPTTRDGARAARGTVDAELLAVLPRRALLRARAAEVDRQGALPPRLRAGARRRPRDRDRRSARDADRALGRDRRRRPAAGSASRRSSRRAAARATRR